MNEQHTKELLYREVEELYAELEKRTARITELERQLNANGSNANLFDAITAEEPTATTRLMFVDLTKDNCFEKFDKALGDKQAKAMLQKTQHDPLWAR